MPRSIALQHLTVEANQDHDTAAER